MEITTILLGILVLLGFLVFVIFYKYIVRGILVLVFGAGVFILGELNIISSVIRNILLGILVGIVFLFFFGHYIWNQIIKRREDEQQSPGVRKRK